MSIKESKSLQFNNISWRVSLLGEEVVLLECGKGTQIEKIHQSTYIIEQAIGGDLIDLVPAYHSVAVFSKLGTDEIIKRLDGLEGPAKQITDREEEIELPICYEEGLDLSKVAENSGMSEDQVIERHLKGTYRSLFIGFTPGFIYADGLHESLACPRLEYPRKRIPSGSVGIAGGQTGIYSLVSPGGWNIIGRTPTRIFDPTKSQPMLINVGTSYRFYRITQKEFDSWQN
ncbi:5-oxoprolinase subunit PxpB [Ekhidna sp.]|uniref:5-oxoprolinase subunit PxpB n=1 Tax=Ekhidna sp. TaxID=2608089 RepID=UPI003C7CB9C5